MNINKTYLILAVLVMLTTDITLPSTLFMGSIQFPETLKTIPDVRLYYAGHKITTQTNNKTKGIAFSICESQNCSTFYVIITNDIQLETPKDSNTIEYLINNNSDYKFYVLKRITKNSEGEPEYEWVIQERPLVENRIPDNAIIVYYNPDYIETLEVENSIRLLKITMKKNIIDLAGSHKKLHDESEMMLCSAINLDSIHTKIKPKTKQFCEKLVVASL